MSSTSNRRGFLRHMLGEVRQGVALMLPDDPAPRRPPQPSEPPPPAGPQVERVPAVAHELSLDELLALTEEVGLGARLDDVRVLARRSARITLADGDGADASTSWVGRDGALPALAEPATFEERALGCVARLDLGAVAVALGASSPFAEAGTLWFLAADEPPSGLALAHRDAVRVALADPAPAEPAGAAPASAEGDDTPATAARAIVLSSELQLPRVWSELVQSLRLDAEEHAAWDRLRDELAQRQGVEFLDAPNRLSTIHRLLGYPDERRGDMPLACELLDRGEDLVGEPARVHPLANGLETEASRRWRLLLQLSIDPELGWSWGRPSDRLYVWVPDEDLAAGDLSRARAFVQ